MTVLRTEVVADDLDFPDAFQVRDNCSFIEPLPNDRKTIQLDIVFKRTAAIDSEGGKLRTARYPDSEGIERLTIRRFVARNYTVLQARIVRAGSPLCLELSR